MTDSESNRVNKLRWIPTTEPQWHRGLERLSLDELKEYKQFENRIGALKFIQREINRRMEDNVRKSGGAPK